MYHDNFVFYRGSVIQCTIAPSNWCVAVVLVSVLCAFLTSAQTVRLGIYVRKILVIEISSDLAEETMPIKYIGRTHTFKGKPLWEILANLKNHGVGRMVIRSNEQRYPEASYMKILKVAALPDTSKHIHDPRKVIVLVEQTFRGKTHPEPVQLDDTTYKPDYVLIHKDEEAKYINATEQPELRIVSRTTDFPPLLKEILIREAQRKREQVPDLKLKLVYNMTGFKNYRIAEEGETPTVTVSMGLGIPASPSLYANVKRPNPP